MRNINKITLRMLLIIGILILYGKAIRFAYESPDMSAPYMKAELRERKGNIDTLFCGTSTSSRGFSPQVWDKERGECSFNIATASQPLYDTYALLKQEVERNPIEKIFLGVSPRVLLKEEISASASTRSYALLDSFKTKIQYLLHEHTVEDMLYLAYYPVRVERYGDLSKVKKNISYKTSSAYKKNISSNKSYTEKGFIADDKMYDGKTYRDMEPKEHIWSESAKNAEQEESLCKIIEYCKEKDIELILVHLPVTGKQVQLFGNAIEIHEYYDEIAKEYNIQFWDFLYYANLLEEYGNDKFRDIRHMNLTGAEQFTHKLHEIYQQFQAGDDIGMYFLDTCPYYQSGTVE